MQAEVDWMRHGNHNFPAVIINNRTYRGDLDAKSIFSSLCAGLQNPPDACFSGYISSSTPPAAVSAGVGVRTLILIVVLMLVCFVTVVLFDRMYLRKKFTEEIHWKFNVAVMSTSIIQSNGKETFS